MTPAGEAVPGAILHPASGGRNRIKTGYGARHLKFFSCSREMIVCNAPSDPEKFDAFGKAAVRDISPGFSDRERGIRSSLENPK